MMRLGRRGLLLASLLAPLEARARGRVPTGGEVTFRVPWGLSRIDPHDLFDPAAAIFASAIADTAYARDAEGRVYPTLADGMPFVEEGTTLVKMRPGLVSARGRPIAGRALAWSVRRARLRGAAGLLAKVTPRVQPDPDRPRVARFGKIDPARLALLLSSPLTAVLPPGFSPTRPDGTGAFAARCSATRLVLERNPRAARGPAYLERLAIHRAPDLGASLRAFEAGRDDVGWLGSGFHRDRRGARRFDHGAAGWVVLVTGQRAGSFTTPGAAQRLANRVNVGRLHVGLEPVGGGGGTAWTEPPAELLYDGAHPHLREVAAAVARELGSTGSELTAEPVGRDALHRKRESGDFALALDVVRPLDVPRSDAIALATADSRQLGLEAGRRRRWPTGAPRRHTTSLHLGVLGALPLMGAAAPGVTIPADRPGAIDWGDAHRRSG